MHTICFAHVLRHVEDGFSQCWGCSGLRLTVLELFWSQTFESWFRQSNRQQQIQGKKRMCVSCCSCDRTVQDSWQKTQMLKVVYFYASASLVCSGVAVTSWNWVFKAWWANCMVCTVFQSRRISCSCSARVIRPRTSEWWDVVPVLSVWALLCSKWAMRDSKCRREKKMCSILIPSAVGCKVVVVVDTGGEVWFWGSATGWSSRRSATSAGGVIMASRSWERYVSGMTEAKQETNSNTKTKNQEPTFKSLGTGVLSLAPAIIEDGPCLFWQKTVSKVFAFRTGVDALRKVEEGLYFKEVKGLFLQRITMLAP